MAHSQHSIPEQEAINRRYAAETVESSSPMRQHWLIWDDG
jgi:hypothetical protein